MTDGTYQRSPARDFGHCRSGWAVTFNFCGFAMRSLTVETEAEAQMIKRQVEEHEDTTRVEVVIDD